MKDGFNSKVRNESVVRGLSNKVVSAYSVVHISLNFGDFIHTNTGHCALEYAVCFDLVCSTMRCGVKQWATGSHPISARCVALLFQAFNPTWDDLEHSSYE